MLSKISMFRIFLVSLTLRDFSAVTQSTKGTFHCLKSSIQDAFVRLMITGIILIPRCS